MKEITVKELKEKIDNGEQFLLLDVREPFEQYQSNIEYENRQLIAPDFVEDKLDEVKAEKDEEVVCMCRSGNRSSQAVELLEEEGFTNVKVLKGGLNQWSKEIDNSLPIY